MAHHPTVLVILVILEYAHNSQVSKVTVPGNAGQPTSAVWPPGGGGCCSIRTGPSAPLWMHMEASADGPLTLLSAGPEGGEPSQDACHCLSTVAERLAVLQEPPPQDGVSKAGTTARGGQNGRLKKEPTKHFPSPTLVPQMTILLC